MEETLAGSNNERTGTGGVAHRSKLGTKATLLLCSCDSNA